MRPRVLLDVDGVLADFLGPFVELFNVVGRRRVERGLLDSWAERTVADVRHYSPMESFGVDQEFDDEVSSLVQPGFCANLPIYPEARDGVEMLQLDADVVFVTAPFNHVPTWVSERRSWLRRHFDNKIGIINTSEKHCVAGDALVDDKRSTLEKWKECHPLGAAIRWRRCDFRDFYPGPETARWADVSRMVSDIGEFMGDHPRHWRNA